MSIKSSGGEQELPKKQLRSRVVIPSFGKVADGDIIQESSDVSALAREIEEKIHAASGHFQPQEWRDKKTAIIESVLTASRYDISGLDADEGPSSTEYERWLATRPEIEYAIDHACFRKGDGYEIWRNAWLIHRASVAASQFQRVPLPAELEAIRERRAKASETEIRRGYIHPIEKPTWSDIDVLLAALDSLTGAEAAIDEAGKVGQLMNAAQENGCRMGVEAAAKSVDICNCGSGPEFRPVDMRYHAATCSKHLATMIRTLIPVSYQEQNADQGEVDPDNAPCVGKGHDAGFCYNCRRYYY